MSEEDDACGKEEAGNIVRQLTESGNVILRGCREGWQEKGRQVRCGALWKASLAILQKAAQGSFFLAEEFTELVICKYAIN